MAGGIPEHGVPRKEILVVGRQKWQFQWVSILFWSYRWTNCRSKPGDGMKCSVVILPAFQVNLVYEWQKDKVIKAESCESQETAWPNLVKILRATPH